MRLPDRERVLLDLLAPDRVHGRRVGLADCLGVHRRRRLSSPLRRGDARHDQHRGQRGADRHRLAEQQPGPQRASAAPGAAGSARSARRRRAPAPRTRRRTPRTSRRSRRRRSRTPSPAWTWKPVCASAHGDDRHEQRRAEDQRPADRARAAEVARERAALGIAQRDEHDGEQQLEVGRCAALRRRTRTRTTSTATVPAALASQNARLGRSPARSTAITAVAAGASPTTIAPCAAVRWCSASDVSSGNPMTTPAATIASERHCAPSGAARASRAAPPRPGRRPRARARRPRPTGRGRAARAASPAARTRSRSRRWRRGARRTEGTAPESGLRYRHGGSSVTPVTHD